MCELCGFETAVTQQAIAHPDGAWVNKTHAMAVVWRAIITRVRHLSTRQVSRALHTFAVLEKRKSPDRERDYVYF
jgi:hypothetical protein